MKALKLIILLLFCFVVAGTDCFAAQTNNSVEQESSATVEGHGLQIRASEEQQIYGTDYRSNLFALLAKKSAPTKNSKKELINQKRTWTLEQCIDYATEHNLQIKRLELSQQNAELQLKDAKNEYLPTANASIGQNYDFGRAPQSDGTLTSRNSSSTNFSANVSIPVFSGFSTRNKIKASKEDLTSAFENLNKAKEDLALNVSTLFINILYQKDFLKSCRIQMDLSKEQTQRISRLVESGKVAKNKLLEMESNLAKDEMAVTEAENAYNLAVLDLIQALELKLAPNDFETDSPDISTIVVEEEGLISAEQIYELAVEQRPSVKAQESTIEASKYALKMAKSTYFPSISIGASYGNAYYNYFGKGFEGNNIPFCSQIDQNNRYTVGVSLSVPIFDRFTTLNSTKKAKLNIRNNQLLLEETKKTLYKEIQQAFYNVEAAQKKFISASKALESTKTAFDFATLSFESEKLSTYELNQAKANYAMSELHKIQAEYDYLLKRKILDFYQGKPIKKLFEMSTK